jgi:hypothetical protein
MDVLIILAAVLVGYFFGAIPFGWISVRLQQGTRSAASAERENRRHERHARCGTGRRRSDGCWRRGQGRRCHLDRAPVFGWDWSAPSFYRGSSGRRRRLDRRTQLVDLPRLAGGRRNGTQCRVGRGDLAADHPHCHCGRRRDDPVDGHGFYRFAGHGRTIVIAFAVLYAQARLRPRRLLRRGDRHFAHRHLVSARKHPPRSRRDGAEGRAGGAPCRAPTATAEGARNEG